MGLSSNPVWDSNRIHACLHEVADLRAMAAWSVDVACRAARGPGRPAAGPRPSGSAGYSGLEGECPRDPSPGRTARTARASQFHLTSVGKRWRRLSSLISQALSFYDADAYAAGEVGFLARALVRAMLPHSDPKTNQFVRHNGHYSLSILAPKGVGLPYGRYPRLVLACLNTEAVKRKTRHIELDHHFSHFCAALAIPPTTGPRGSLPQLREQMQRLFSSTFQCVFHDEEKGRHAGDGFLIAEKRALWWDPRRETGDAPWGSHVVLSERASFGRRPRPRSRSTSASCGRCDHRSRSTSTSG